MSRRGRILLALALVAVALLLALRWVSRPQTVARIVVAQVGEALGLEISSDGAAEYRLRGTPMLVLRRVVIREPGSSRVLLSAERIHIALPWATLRAGGSELVARRIELDSPRLDLPALQHWLATRPPAAERRLPTLTDGLRIRDGAIANDDWGIDGIDADVPVLDPASPLRARLRGRYVDAPLSIPVDLAVSIVHPDALVKTGSTGFATHGRVTFVQENSWRMPATVMLSGPLRLDADDLRIAPARMGMAATLQTETMRVPFALGLHGPLLFDEGIWTLAPAGLALRAGAGAGGDEDPVPTLDAHGSIELGQALSMQLDGALAQWPDGWPALPPPIGQSSSSLPFSLRYHGAAGFNDVASLRLQRDATRFDGRFRLPQVLEWLEQKQGTPLPPLTGTLSAPRLEISGATLEGVEVVFGDAEASGAGP